MSSKEDGIIVILSSPSGAGKTTLAKLLSKKKISVFQFLTLLENQDKTKYIKRTIILSMKKILKD